MVEKEGGGGKFDRVQGRRRTDLDEVVLGGGVAGGEPAGGGGGGALARGALRRRFWVPGAGGEPGLVLRHLPGVVGRCSVRCAALA